MKPVVRIVKRGEREAATSSHSADGARAAQQSTSEVVAVVKSWIRESRERRQAAAEDYRRVFRLTPSPSECEL